MRHIALFMCLLIFGACRADGETKWIRDIDGDGYAEGEDCDDNDPAIGAPTTYYVDADGDDHGDPDRGDGSCSRPEGYALVGDDCDDTAPTTYPGAPELCDDIDNDCDGLIDDGVPNLSWYADVDGDAYGDAATLVEDCAAPEGMVADNTDCDDDDATINPAALEVCDGIDNDCNGLVDDGLDSATWYVDADGDGYGDDATGVYTCAPASGTVDLGGDCDDADIDYHPNADEFCTDPNDYNCDGSVGYADLDGDGFAACEECDDGNSATFPGADETCNGLDDDCDGSVDEDAIDPATWYADLDGDGFGDATNTTLACDVPAGYVADATDCDDGRFDVNPGATEVCDGFDNDCDTLVDDADPSLDTATAATWYADADADGYGDPSSAYLACDGGTDVSLGGDCDDADAAYNPGASELDCTDPNDYNCDGSVGAIDADGDGYYACEECDDADAAVNPLAAEVCDGVDNDCDGTVDVGAIDPSTWYADADTDGYGDPAATLDACDAPAGYVADETDCDDTEAAINPSQTELCNGWDDNCDGVIDTDAADASTWYADTDGDGFGDPGSTTRACDAPADYVADSLDCDDADGAVNPDAAEVCDGIDNDCDGSIDTGVGSVWYADDDGDGYGDASSSTLACDVPAGYLADATDCDDTDAAINPAAAELCDGLDNDCDTLIDEDSATATYYADIDGDGYGDAGSTVDACSIPPGYRTDATDCDDSRSDINPGASEVCDGLDNDCDTLVDDEDDSLDTSTASVWYADADGDGYGDDASTVLACDEPAGTSALGGDCDDGDSAYNPGALEVDCTDPNDYNCDGSVGTVDADGDGYYACEECDDGDAAVNPAGTELCDGVDNDCDGTVDEADAVDASTWYADADADTYGDPAVSVTACSAPSRYVADDTDCDDSDTTVNPAATEVCDGVDNDCDGSIDEGFAPATWYVDADADGYGDASTAASTTCDGAPAGYVADDTDCDDADAAVNPAATEACDGVDNDCDGSIDEGFAPTTWYADADGDGYGDPDSASTTCDGAPSGYLADDTDCDDTDDTINPAGTEVCDGVDNDCDGSIDEGFAPTTWYADADGDGYGDPDTATTTCDGAPSGYLADGTDCDDTDASINPGATEVCDTLDNNCDGSIDEGGVCPCDVEVYDGHVYLFCNATTEDWDDARTTCLSFGYELATVGDDAENTWIVTTGASYGGGNWWIGLNDQSTEGTYEWSSGEAVSYTNWSSSEPNGGRRVDCVHFKASRGTWADHTCGTRMQYVCEE